jgi:hypothetical protein
MVEFEELRNFNATNLYEKLINLNNDEFEDWLAENKQNFKKKNLQFACMSRVQSVEAEYPING